MKNRYSGTLLVITALVALPLLAWAQETVSGGLLGFGPSGGPADITLSRTESSGSPILEVKISGTEVATFTSSGMTVDAFPSLSATSYVRVGTNPASARALRTANGADGGWAARNNANTSNVDLMYLGTDDAIYIGNDSDATGVVLGYSGNYANVPGYLRIGTNPATTGAVRLANNAGVYWRNSGGSANIGLLVNASNVLATDATSFVMGTTAGVDTTLTETSATTPLLAINNAAEAGSARMSIQSVREVHTLAAAATSDTTTITIPSGSELKGCSFNVNSAVSDDAGDDTWSAAFVTGSTTALATGAAAAQDTKVSTLIASEIASDATEVRFTPNGGSFSGGVIEVVCYYIDLTDLSDV